MSVPRARAVRARLVRARRPGRARWSTARLPLIPGAVLALLPAACLTVRRAGSGDADAGALDRAALARCATYDPDGWSLRDVEGLAGEWRLTLAGAGEARTAGGLVLRSPTPEERGDAGGPPLSGADPLLIGWSDAPFAEVGALVPGPADARDAAAPGVALYAFEQVTEDAEEEGAAPVAVLRVGAESNRRDRQRFDGAHTTLRVVAIGEDRFGGTWSSAEAADDRGGSFCAVRR